MKKRLPAVLLALALALGLCVGTFADIAYEPADNYYESHRDQCDYENRYYYTNGPEGYVQLCKSPGGTSVTVLPNGGLYYVSYTSSRDGAVWGCVEYDPDNLASASAWNGGRSGWVRMDQMQVEYDFLRFAEDHGDAILNEEAELRLGAEGEALCYKYPGSGIVTGTIGNYSGGDYETVSFSQTYTDGEGRRWGFLGYYYGHRNLWVCLSDPFNELPAGEEYVEVQLIPAAEPVTLEDAARAAGLPTVYLVGGAAALVLIAGAVLAVVLRRRKK